MDSLEFNKIAAGLLMGLLLAFGIGKLGNVLYGPQITEHAVEHAAGDTVAAADDHGETPAAAPVAEAVPIAALLAGADLANGEKQFRKCKSCHTIEAGGPNGQGPNLYGIVGSPQARSDSFNYSGVLADLGGTWTFEDLSLYITDPKAYAPGNKMVFKGIRDDRDRADLIAWLNTRSDAPLALPENAEPEDSMPGTQAPEAAVEEVPEAAAEEAGAAGTLLEEAEARDSADDPILVMIAAASVDDGRSVARKCRACHTFDEGGADRVGPNLWDVVDRDIADIEDFNYSKAMEAEEGAWTYHRLWTYLENPRADLPGGKMGFRGLRDEEDLAAVIAWMRTLSDAPSPLPGIE